MLAIYFSIHLYVSMQSRFFGWLIGHFLKRLGLAFY